MGEHGKCFYCETDNNLEYCESREPWYDEHLICPNCDSTYCLNKDKYGNRPTSPTA